MKENLFTTRNMAMMALFTALTCILAPLSLPIGPVPISLTNLVIYLSLFILGTKKAALSFIVYLLLGLVGLPVFSGFTGGVAKLAGPTGGYIIGFLFMAIVAGLFVDKFEGRLLPSMVGMILGTAIAYVLGTAWFVYVMNCELMYALTVCVFPFIIGDLAKMVVACLIGQVLRNRLSAAGLLPV